MRHTENEGEGNRDSSRSYAGLPWNMETEMDFVALTNAGMFASVVLHYSSKAHVNNKLWNLPAFSSALGNI